MNFTLLHTLQRLPLSYLEDVPAEVGGVRDLERDPGSIRLDAASGLDLVGLVAAEVARRGHDHHLLEVRDLWNNLERGESITTIKWSGSHSRSLLYSTEL